MMASRTRKKTVQFFEVRDAKGAKIPDGVLDWPKILLDISRQSVDDCKHSVGLVDHWGRIYNYNETDHFILARLREDGVSSFDIQNETFIDLESHAENPYVELSIAKFLGNSNRFGFVLGSNASSRVNSLEGWMNAHRVFTKDISIIPLVSSRVLAKIQNADEAKLLRVRMDRDQLGMIKESSGLFSLSKDLERKHGSIDLDLTIRVKGKINDRRKDEREKILDTARTVIDSPFSRAEVDLVTYDADGRPSVEHVNFLNDLLARKMTVSVTDKEGNPVRIPSAIEAIDRAAKLLQDEFDALG